jgi:outer membrane protein insertion porin family
LGAALAALLVAAVPASADVVAEIGVEGNQRLSRDRILLSFGVAIGQELSIDAVREGIRRLYETGNFADVRVETEPTEDGGLRLIVVVSERPRITGVEFEGNDKIGDSDIEEVLRIEAGTPFDSSRLEDSRVALLELYETKGFPYATVETRTEESSGNAVRVYIDIVENTRVTVEKIAFTGNNSIEGIDLRKVMEIKEDRWWRTDAFLDKGVLADDLVRIVDRYREDGFIDATVRGYETEYDESGEKVTVTIDVDEGALYEVAAYEWIGASEFAEDALYDLTTVEIGDTYRPADAEETIREAYGWYGERGYIHARIFRVEDVEEGNTVRLGFNVEEGEPARIGEIRIVGNKRTKEKVIRRELAVRPGDLYRTSEVIASQRKIANLGFFYGPSVEFAESRNPNDIDLIFTVEERQTGRAGVGISHTSEKGITGFLELTEGNLFGNGQFLDLKWEFGKNNTEVVLGFTEPWFLGRDLSVGFDVYDTDDRRSYGSLSDEFYEEAFSEEKADKINGAASDRYILERERRGGDVRVGWPFMGSRNTTLYTKYTLEQFRLSEYAEIRSDIVDTSGFVTDSVTEDVFRDDDRDWEWRSGLTATLARRTTDRRFHPRMGSYTRFTADLFGGVFGGDVEYQRYILDTRKHIPAFWITTLMLRGRAGVVTGYGDPGTVPNDTRFEMGGVGLNGIRGYDNRAILPEGRDVYGGRTMLLGSAELKFPITDEREQLPIYGLFFVDAGNTWESAEDTHPTQLYWGAGAGVRVELPVLGNLGIDMGYGLDEDEGGEWVVHYQFGLSY